MLELIVTLALSLNLQFVVIDENSLKLKEADYNILTTSNAFIDNLNNGKIHDLNVIWEESTQMDIIIFPEVDPVEIR